MIGLKSARWMFLAAWFALFSGCAVIPHIGILYTEAQHPVRWEPPEGQVFLQNREYSIKGQTRGEATVENYLGLVAMGDYGITTAYRNALRNAGGADLLLDVHVDQHTMRVLGFYIKATTIVTGTAVRIQGSPGVDHSGMRGASTSRPRPDRPASPPPEEKKKKAPAKPPEEKEGDSEENPWWGK